VNSISGEESPTSSPQRSEEIGADDLLFSPTVDDLAEIERLAEIVR
jgi:hypothetical protein